jgi:hypothetical protein
MGLLPGQGLASQMIPLPKPGEGIRGHLSGNFPAQHGFEALDDKVLMVVRRRAAAILVRSRILSGKSMVVFIGT